MDSKDNNSNTGTDKKWIFLLFLFLILIYPTYFSSNSSSGNTFIKGDCFYYRAVIDSLLQDRDLLMANNIQHDLLNGQLALGTNGLVPKHPILMPLISIPFYFLFGDTGLLLFNAINCVLLHTFIFKINRLFFDQLISLITSVIYASATLFLDYSYNYSPDIFSTLLVISGLYYVLINRFYLGAFLLGLSVFAKLTNFPLVAAILLYSIFVIMSNHKVMFKKSITISITMMTFIFGILPLAYTNHFLFGSPFITGYQRTAIAGPTQDEIVTSNHVSKFNQPLFINSIRMLFDRHQGAIPTNLIVLLAFIGGISMRRKDIDKRIILIAAICLIQFIMFAKYDEWHTSHFSNRFLMTTIALSSIFTSRYLSNLFAELKLDPER